MHTPQTLHLNPEIEAPDEIAPRIPNTWHIIDDQIAYSDPVAGILQGKGRFLPRQFQL